MNRTHVALVVLAAVGLLAAGGAAVYTGIAPVPGGDAGEDLEDFPTETPSASGGDSSSSGGDSSSSGGDATEPPFSFVIDDIEECGTTCRDVTVTLENQQDQPATGVTVYTRIYAGQDNTASDDLLWQGAEPVGSLAADEATTHTERVELSFRDGLAIEQHDGWITVVTTVETDERTVTFTDDRQVA